MALVLLGRAYGEGAAHVVARQHPQETSAFTFDTEGRDRVLVRRSFGKVIPIRAAEVESLYGKPEGLRILTAVEIGGRRKMVDVCSPEHAGARRLRGALRPMYQDLSDAAGWPKVHVKPGRVAIDPRYGRLKFYEGYDGKISLVKRVPTPHGNPFGLAAKGDYLFLGMGESKHGMLVIDASDPSNMQVVAEAPKRGPWILDVEAAGDLAFSSDARCVNIYDVTDPPRPKVLCHFASGAKYMFVDMDEKLVYYRCGDHKILRRLDISDPEHPKRLPPWPRKYKQENSYYRIRHGKFAYLCVYVPVQPEEEQQEPDEAKAPTIDEKKDEGTWTSTRTLETPDDDGTDDVIRAFDQADEKKREQEQRRKQIEAEKAAVSSKEGYYGVTRIFDTSAGLINPKLIAEMKPGHIIRQIVEQNGKSYALGTAPKRGIAVYDLASPITPKLICVHAPVPGGWWVLVDGYIYATTGHPDGKRGGLYLLEFKDVLKPPRLVGRLNKFDRRYMEHRSGWKSLLVRGDHAFVLDYFYGIVAIDVSDRTSPRIVGGLHTAGEAFCIDTSETRVFIGENMGGLTIIDNTVPEEARVVGNFGIGAGWGVAARGNIAFCANLGGLMILDCTDPKNPEELSYVGGINNALAVKVQGNYAYCMGNAGYGDIIEIRDLRKPKRLGRFRTSRSFQFDVKGNYLYVADHREGLVIFDTSDKMRPKRVATVKRGGGAGRVSIKGEYAFVGAPPGLQVIDISDPTNPVIRIAARSGCGGLVCGDYVYSTSYFGRNNLRVTDISDLRNPKFLEGFDPGGYSYGTGCSLQGDYLYLSSLPYLSICKVPMSSEAPRKSPTVECATSWGAESLAETHRGNELSEQAAKLLPTRTDPTDVDIKAVHELMGKLMDRTALGATESHRALSEASARLLGLDFRLAVAGGVVPGFGIDGRLTLRNRGKEEVRLRSLEATAMSKRVNIALAKTSAITPVKPGGSIDRPFRFTTGVGVKPGESLPVLAACSYEYAGTVATVRQKWTVRAESLLSVGERIPRLEVSNLDPCRFSFSVTNNTREPQSVVARLRLPGGWDATPGAEQAIRIAGRATAPVTFAVKLPDAEAENGLLETPLSLSVDGKVHFTKTIEAEATRLMRWRVMGPFPFDITSKERPIPENEVKLDKEYGQRVWRAYVCNEAKPIDLVPPKDNTSRMPKVAFYYGATYIHGDRERDVKLSVTGDAAMLSGNTEIKGWLNGRQAIGKPMERPLLANYKLGGRDDDGGPDESLLIDEDLEEKAAKPPHLNKGWNLLLVRVCYIYNWAAQEGGRMSATTPKWPFRLVMHDLKGKELKNITLDSEQWGQRPRQ